MTESAPIEVACREFAKITGELEDAAEIAAHGQSVADLASARDTCERLSKLTEAIFVHAQRLRKHLG